MRHAMKSGMAALAVAAMCGTAMADFTAFNDCVNASDDAKVTAYQGEMVWGGIPNQDTGYLKDYATGAETGVTVKMIGSGIGLTTEPSNGLSGDAAATFGNKIKFYKNVSECDTAVAWSYTAVFTGLDPNKVYEFTTYANRGHDGFWPADPNGKKRFTKFSIDSADAFVNASTVGDDTFEVDGAGVVALNTGWNDTGSVIKWTGIVPGADGSFSVTSGSFGENDLGIHAIRAYGMAGFMLKETAVPEPASLALFGLGGLALLRRRK